MSDTRIEEEGRKKGEEAPTRLRDDKSSLVGQWLRAIPQEASLSEIELARIHMQLTRPPQRGRPVRLFGLRMAMVVVLLIVGASVGAAAAVVSARWLKRVRKAEAQLAMVPSNRQASKPRNAGPASVPVHTDSSETDLLEMPPSVEPDQAQVAPPQASRVNVKALRPSAAKARISASALQPAAAPEAAPSETLAVQPQEQLAAAIPSALEQEASFMSAALRNLRQGKGQEAIPLLKRYLQEHPRGAFHEEAQVALLTALVDEGSHDQAQSLLNAAAPHLAATPALKLVRAELVFAKSCVEALPIFTQVLAAKEAAALQERALYGSAMSEWRCGDRSRARLLMETFMHRFPSSKRAANVKTHLEQAHQRQLNPRP